MWPNHRQAVQREFHQTGVSGVVVLPTGAGKTTVSSLKIAGVLARGKKVVFLAPTHALVGQTQRALKGSKEFQDEAERMIIVSNIKAVDKAVLSVDQDRTVCKTIEKIVNDYGDDYTFSFANGGDQNNQSIPEVPVCERLNVTLIDGLGDKIQSSSILLKNQ
jgi:D-beta-D-heptose 7-phosphate kinase/D-beta-D-heptose 1-phosphate adenosyltransferase